MDSQAAALRSHLLMVLFALVSFVSSAAAQAERPTLAPEPVIPPSQLFEQLSSPDTPRFAQQKASALKSLGIELKELTDFRLVYEDLDGDGNPEALFTIEVISDVSLVILKNKGSQWYRLASPPEFSCWCKYENSPLDSFAEVQGWFYGKNEPTRLVLVRGSSGGTGLYTRGLGIYILRGFELTEVFSASEEYDECALNVSNCTLHHQDITAADDSDHPALVVTSYEKRELADSEFHRNTWWIGSPVQRCRAYTWNPQRAKFLENATATAFYCNRPAKKTSPTTAR